MAEFTYGDKVYHTSGPLPLAGSKAPEFIMTKDDLSEIRLSDCLGKITILNIFPSLDTPTCAKSVKRFNKIGIQQPKTLILCVSADLPFAQKRFCHEEHCQNIIPVSTFRNSDFGDLYGLRITDGPLEGLLARVVIVLDPEGTVICAQLIRKIEMEPDYDAVLECINRASSNIKS